MSNAKAINELLSKLEKAKTPKEAAKIRQQLRKLGHYVSGRKAGATKKDKKESKADVKKAKPEAKAKAKKAAVVEDIEDETEE